MTSYTSEIVLGSVIVGSAIVGSAIVATLGVVAYMAVQPRHRGK
jgi:hypothetical protein